jgi:hypothetical protein
MRMKDLYKHPFPGSLSGFHYPLDRGRTSLLCGGLPVLASSPLMPGPQSGLSDAGSGLCPGGAYNSLAIPGRTGARPAVAGHRGRHRGSADHLEDVTRQLQCVASPFSPIFGH